MAEIATIAGAAITIPGLLSGSYTVLKFAYDLYGQVDLRKTQLKLFLDRCNDLLVRVAQSLPSEGGVSDGTRENIEYFQATCESLRDVIEKLKRKGFLWCMVNTDKIDTQMSDVQDRIADAFALFNFGAHIRIEEFHQRLLQARDQDQMQLITRLDTLSENDQQILNALKYQDGAQKRVEELLVDVLKCVQNLEKESPQARFLHTASVVLQKASKKKDTPEMISADYVITSLEVDFQDTDPIGEGGFGRVFKGEWSGSRVAIKQMYIEDARTLSEKDRKVMYREVRVWRQLHHPNILNLFGACLEATKPFLVMQYCPSGNMCQYLEEHPDTNRIDISYDVVAGMMCLHNKGIVHADLKGANILIDKGTALVADFGLSAVIDGIRSRSAQSSIAAKARGTLQWMAPECHEGEPPVKASDIYSLGLTIWEAFSGEIPYKDVNRRGLARAVVDRNIRPGRPDSLTEEAVWTLIQECWVRDAGRRPSIEKVQSRLSPYTTRLHSFVLRTHSPAIRSQSPAQQNAIRTPPVNMQPSQTTQSVLEQDWARSLRDGTPKWTRGNPSSYIDVLTIPKPPSDTEYKYRVVMGDVDLGIKPTYSRNGDGSQSINLLEYNRGFGISDRTSIKVYAVGQDGVETEEMLVAQWDGK